MRASSSPMLLLGLLGAALSAQLRAATEIVFSSPKSGAMQLYSFVEGGTPTRALTSGPGDSDEAAWSPDGAWLAFVSTRAGSPQVYVMQADGSGQRRISMESDSSSSPAWSPDGKRLAYSSHRAGKHGVDVADLSGLSNSGDLAAASVAPPWRRLAELPLGASGLSWVPNGVQISFAAASGGRRSVIFTLDTQSGAVRDFPQAKEVSASNAVWAPDGQRMAFVESAGRAGVNVYIADADGMNRQAVTKSILLSGSPAWSPDGRYLAYTSVTHNGERGDIFVYELASRVSRNLSNHPHEDTRPAWGPDSQQIYFMSFRSGTSQLYRASLDGVVDLVSLDSKQHEETPLPRPQMIRKSLVAASTGPMYRPAAAQPPLKE